MRGLLNICGFILFCGLNTYGQQCAGSAGQLSWHYWQNLVDDEHIELFENEFYPNTPDGSIVVYKLQSPINFDNRFGSLVRGFIHVPETSKCVFNVTGDDKVMFMLSSDGNPENLDTAAYSNSYTGIESHGDPGSTQTSDTIQLVQGVDYYFELRHIEWSGGDHSTVYWKTEFLNNTEWQIVHGDYLKDYTCSTTCPVRGQFCDDGDPLTTNDVEDGFCNCAGVPITQNNCVGEPYSIQAYYWDNITGSDLNSMYNHTNYPFSPNRSEILHGLRGPIENMDNYGTRMQGYLSVPVTGEYQFNVTGNSQTIFFISPNENPEDVAYWIMTLSSTGLSQHDKYITQSSSNLFLEKGKLYYIELNHKESTGSDYFSIFWKTPFHDGLHWKRIPGHYLLRYDCDIACIPENNPCDDGDPYTNNDRYNDNCECIGDPCIGVECDDPIASYQSFESCSYTEQISNKQAYSWLSCENAQSPNPARGQSVWIQYDFGQPYRLVGSHIWNYNVQGATSAGFRNVAIDYSVDGENWVHLDNYIWDEANGSASYEGFDGPDFGDVPVRYVLITALDNWSNPGCSGFSKVTFQANSCPMIGSSCDDGNALTTDDVYDAYCQCNGNPPLVNACDQDTLMLDESIIVTNNYTAIEFVHSLSMVQMGSNVNMLSGQEVELGPGFNAELGSIVIVDIIPCNTLNSNYTKLFESTGDKSKNEFAFEILNTPDEEVKLLAFYLPEDQEISFHLIKSLGDDPVSLIHNLKLKAGYYEKKIRTKKLNVGLSAFQLSSDKFNETRHISQ